MDVEQALTDFENLCKSLLKHNYNRGATEISKTLIDEEACEAIDALENDDDDAATLKELCDVVYVAVGTAVARGWKFNEAFQKVHASNMSKLQNCEIREDGKILKGPNYKKPDLTDCV